MELIKYDEQTKIALFSYHSDSEIAQLPTMTKRAEGKLSSIGFVGEGSKALSDMEYKMYSLTADNEWVEYELNSGGGGSSEAVDINYDNTESGLSATNVQNAIDELTEEVTELSETVGGFDARISEAENTAEEAIEKSENAVLTTAQGLTDTQKAQARTNIGIPSNGYVNKGTVATVADLPSSGINIEDFYTVAANGHIYMRNPQNTQWVDVGTAFSTGNAVIYSPQTLSDTEKEQARTNIGAESIADANQIKQDITQLEEEIGKLYDVTYETGSYFGEVGSIATFSNNAAWKHCKFNPLNYTTLSVKTYTTTERDIICVDDNMVILAKFSTESTSATVPSKIPITIPNGTKIVLIPCYNNDSSSVDIYGLNVGNEISLLKENDAYMKERIEEISKQLISSYDLSYTDGNISSGGVVDNTPTDKGNCKSNKISRNDFVSIEVTVPNGFLSAYCKYNGDTFISRSAWNTSSYSITNEEKDIIILLAASSSGYNKDAVIEACSVRVYTGSISERIENVEKKTKGLDFDFSNIFAYADSGNKIIHFSVDDTWECIKDITDNEYDSIFDNAFLGKLEELHDTYGICVTLNTFNTNTEDSSYDISNVPTRYQTEFQANKHWLRFAFHAESDIENYDTSSGISASYDKFVSAIYELTGDYDCIDRITRLGFFGGSIGNVLAIKNKEHGIIGLLCADSTARNSYYLSTKQNKIVQKQGKYLDVENQIIMLKTITRNMSDAISEIIGNLCYQKYVEVFMHEYEGNPSFGTVANWAKENGYVSAFPSDLLG